MAVRGGARASPYGGAAEAWSQRRAGEEDWKNPGVGVPREAEASARCGAALRVR